MQHNDEPLPIGRFDERVSFDDAKPPFPGWNPNPEQIRERCLLIQSGWSSEERQRRLRADWRPQVRASDGRLVAVAADDYERHHENHEALAAESER